MPLPPDHPGLNPDHPVLLFDGVCNLCSRTVQFVIRHQQQAADTPGTLRFGTLQSPAAERLLAAVNAPVPLPDSMIVIDGGVFYARSDAALRMLAHLGWPWKMLTVFRILPRPMRDGLYKMVAGNRYTLFGKRDACMVPTPDLRARFLD
ncbi:MAG: DCC1-like thiol-disulfide oxidoreductase family protein [Phycisphaerales bacterium]